MSSIATSLTDDDLPQLVQKCIEGCQSAMLELVERFRGRVFGLCFHMLGKREDAEEATQETFLRVLRHLPKWDSSRAFEPWLLTIAGNRCRTALETRQRQHATESLANRDLLDRQSLGSEAELAEEIQQALGKLRADYKEAFLLFHEQERSYVEIAEILQVPVGTVKTWVHRARKEMVEHLKQRGIWEVQQSCSATNLKNV